MKKVRIGAGAGFAGDRIDPAVELARFANLDYLVFECLAERTTALSHLRMREDPEAGYDPLLLDRMAAVLPDCRRNGTRIVGNMGAANPRAAAKKTIELARALGLHGLRVAYVEGDDVLHLKRSFTPFNEQLLPAAESFLSANAYLGAEPVAEALSRSADVVLTGRVADPSLFLGALIHSFGWNPTAWEQLGQGIAVGHLLECAGQLTGGYFADPGYKDVPDLDRLGFPFAIVDESGSALLTKLDGSGGVLNLQTCREQMLYEVLDPSSYATPDVMADFTAIHLEEEAPNHMRVSGGRGTARPADLKVSIGIDEGVLAEGQISYAGPGAIARAQLARDILAKRMANSAAKDLRFDLIGVNAILGDQIAPSEPSEVRLRAAARFTQSTAAWSLAREVESLYLNGPAGGSGVTTSVRENITIVPALVARELVTTTVVIEEA